MAAAGFCRIVADLPFVITGINVNNLTVSVIPVGRIQSVIGIDVFQNVYGPWIRKKLGVNNSLDFVTAIISGGSTIVYINRPLLDYVPELLSRRTQYMEPAHLALMMKAGDAASDQPVLATADHITSDGAVRVNLTALLWRIDSTVLSVAMPTPRSRSQTNSLWITLSPEEKATSDNDRVIAEAVLAEVENEFRRIEHGICINGASKKVAVETKSGVIVLESVRRAAGFDRFINDIYVGRFACK